MQNITPVILCGGSGTRLWPLSCETYPKQFVELGGGKTLFKDTVMRAQHVPGSTEPVIVCNEAHRFYVTAELYTCGLTGQVLLEPAPRNTAPAIALAAFALRSGDAAPLMLILPSDHAIGDETAFFEGVERAAVLADQGHIVTFGIAPTGPETGFGYIEQGDAIGSEGYRVVRFVEKPRAEVAVAMLVKGGYSWNSGIFLLRASVYLGELERFAPQIYAACRSAWEGRKEDKVFCRPDSAAFLSSPADSLDYAVWEAFYQTGQQDECGNVWSGDVISEETENCSFNATHRLLTAIGVSGLVVAETQDAVLVAPRDRVQDVKKIVGRLQCDNRPERQQHPLVYRPWGS